MEEIAISCQVSCHLCGWNTGATLFADKANLFGEILSFLNRCWEQHPSQRPAGKLQIVWEPLKEVSNR